MTLAIGQHCNRRLAQAIDYERAPERRNAFPAKSITGLDNGLENVVLTFEIASLVEFALVLLRHIFRIRWLPLGGGDVQQIGIVFGAAYIVSRTIELAHIA
jgi:hypothetical protein